MRLNIPNPWPSVASTDEVLNVILPVVSKLPLIATLLEAVKVRSCVVGISVPPVEVSFTCAPLSEVASAVEKFIGWSVPEAIAILPAPVSNAPPSVTMPSAVMVKSCPLAVGVPPLEVSVIFIPVSVVASEVEKFIGWSVPEALVPEVITISPVPTLSAPPSVTMPAAVRVRYGLLSAVPFVVETRVMSAAVIVVSAEKFICPAVAASDRLCSVMSPSSFSVCAFYCAANGYVSRAESRILRKNNFTIGIYT